MKLRLHLLPKVCFFLLALTCISSTNAQGIETFDGLTAGASGYATRNWTGQDGSMWSGTNSRTDQGVNGTAITMNDDTSNTFVQSGTLLGGIGNFTITTQRKFGSSGSGTLDILINGTSIGTVPYSGTVQTTTISGVNISGDFVIRVDNNIGGNNSGGADRVAIDDVTWTAFAASNVDNPQTFTATASSASQIDLAATANVNTNDILVAFNTTDTFGSPMGTYMNGATITGGGTVFYSGAATGLPNHMGLNPATTYFYKAWSYDGTEYSNGLTDDATTLCDAFTIPFTEGFENGVPPNCWTSFRGQNGLGANQDWQVSGTANTGSNAASVSFENVSGGEAEDWLVTGLIDLTGANNTQLKYFERNSDFFPDLSTYSIRVSTASQNVFADFTTVVSYTNEEFNDVYSERSVDLSAYDGMTVYVAFVMTQDNGDRWFVDDVSIDERVNVAPMIDNIVQTPSSVTSDDTVTVSADVTDDSATAPTVSLNWGTTSGSLGNSISMTASGDTFTTVSSIPMQSEGSTVYYEIVATDSETLSTTSDEQSYTVQANVVTVIDEDFSDCGATSWIAVSVASNSDWTCGSGYQEINAFGGDVASDDYLISPEINVDAYNNDILSFVSFTRFSDPGTPIELLYTDNYTGDPSTTTWATVSATFAPENSQTNTPSGDIDVSALMGTAGRFAFHYTSSGTGAGTTTLWRIDDIMYTGTAAANVGPNINNIVIDPTTPDSNDTVSVSADVTDVDGIASVVLNWGTTSGVLSDAISMNLDSGDSYVTASDIPAQVAGTTVYFSITATDSNASPEATTSMEQSYTVIAANEAPMINNIAIDPITPDQSDTVSVSADVTDDRDAAEDLSVQLNWGTMTGSLTNVIAMSVTSGDTFMTVSDIPQQTTGTQVFYTITATDNDSPALSTTTAEQSYTVADAGVQGFSYTETGGWTPNDPSSSINPSRLIDSVSIFSGDAVVEGNVDCRIINISSGATTFTVNGSVRVVQTINNSGTSFNATALTFVNNTFHGLSGNTGSQFNVGDLTMDNAADQTLDIVQGVILNVSGVFTATTSPTATVTFQNTNGTIVLKSNSTSTGTLINTENATFDDAITVERFIPAKRAFRLLSAPVVSTEDINANWQNGEANQLPNMNVNAAMPGFGTHITGGTFAQGFDATETNNPSMFTITQNATTGASYTAVGNTNATNFALGEGYLILIRGDRSVDLSMNDATPTPTVLSATGTIATGDFAVPTAQLNNGANVPADRGSSLVGNPYQARVDMKRVLEDGSTTDINPIHYHVYDPTIGTRGAFVTVEFGATPMDDTTNYSIDNANGNMDDDASPTEATRYLQPGQSAFVNTLPADLGGLPPVIRLPALTFKESHKENTNDGGDVFLTGQTTSTTATPRLNIALFNTNEVTANDRAIDALSVKFDNSYDNELDIRDAFKAQNLDENMASRVGEYDFSIQSRKMPIESDEIELSMSNYRTNDYSFRVSVSGLNNVTAYLSDTYLNTLTELSQDDVTFINFSIDASDDESSASNRFKIVFTENVLGTSDSELNTFSVYPNPVSNGILNINLSNDITEASVALYNLIGQRVLDGVLTTSQSILDVTNLSSGVYIVEVTSGNTTNTQRIVID